MIGPLHLGQVLTHIGMNLLCTCCCPEEKIGGGRQFYGTPDDIPDITKPVKKPTKRENPFIQFTPVVEPTADVEEISGKDVAFPETDGILRPKEDTPERRLPAIGASVRIPDKVATGVAVIDNGLMVASQEYHSREEEFLTLLLASIDEDCCCEC